MKKKMRIANKVRRLRFDHGEMTQQALAEMIGATRQTVLAIEGGKYAPSLELAFRIADAFGVGVEAVFQREYSGEKASAWRLLGQFFSWYRPGKLPRGLGSS